MMSLPNEKTFLRTCAIMAILSAATTFLLWFLPRLYETPDTFEAHVLLRNNFYYLGRLWVNFIHIPIALASYFGLTVLLFKRHARLASFGMLWFVMWGLVEMIGVSIIIFTVNFNWRTQFARASEAQQHLLQNNIESFSSIWDSMFFVLLVAFLLGSICFSLSTWAGKGLEKILSYLLWMSVPLTIFIILAGYAGQAWAGSISDTIYPVLQPVSRVVMGIFIWKNSVERKL